MQKNQETQRTLTVSAAAARLGVSAKTLRAWADKGQVPHMRTPSGYRRFSEEQIEETRKAMLRGEKPASG